MIKSLSLIALLGAATLAPQAQAAGNIDCQLSFNLSGWSVFYKTASGTGHHQVRQRCGHSGSRSPAKAVA